jgi:hypothetical protein
MRPVSRFPRRRCASAADAPDQARFVAVNRCQKRRLFPAWSELLEFYSRPAEKLSRGAIRPRQYATMGCARRWAQPATLQACDECSMGLSYPSFDATFFAASKSRPAYIALMSTLECPRAERAASSPSSRVKCRLAECRSW